MHKGNNKITELRTILQRESQNSYLYKQTTSVNYGPLCRETSRFVNQGEPPRGLTNLNVSLHRGRNCFIIFLPMFYRLSPLWGEIVLFSGEQYGWFPAAQMFANVL